jgi:trans-aconitate methyltransferase
VLHHELTSWQNPEFAHGWARRDGLAGLLALPRALSAALVAQEDPEVEVIVDIASGPGAFLECYLDEFPSARGIWTDGSAAMEDWARQRLARFGDRVEYRVLDMTTLADAGLPGNVDVLLSSRALHHLTPVELAKFYAGAAGLVRPGGWVVNLDHTDQPWADRYRTVMRRFTGPSVGGHKHDHPAPTVEDHLAALRAAGLDADIVWKAGRTVLFQAQAGRNARSA